MRTFSLFANTTPAVCSPSRSVVSSILTWCMPSWLSTGMTCGTVCSTDPDLLRGDPRRTHPPRNHTVYRAGTASGSEPEPTLRPRAILRDALVRTQRCAGPKARASLHGSIGPRPACYPEPGSSANTCV